MAFVTKKRAFVAFSAKSREEDCTFFVLSSLSCADLERKGLLFVLIFVITWFMCDLHFNSFTAASKLITRTVHKKAETSGCPYVWPFSCARSFLGVENKLPKMLVSFCTFIQEWTWITSPVDCLNHCRSLIVLSQPKTKEGKWMNSYEQCRFIQ